MEKIGTITDKEILGTEGLSTAKPRLTARAILQNSQGQIAVMYAVAYWYEHREEADHQELTLSLRALLFGIRKEVF